MKLSKPQFKAAIVGLYVLLIALAIPPHDVVSWVGTGVGTAATVVAAGAYADLLEGLGFQFHGQRMLNNEHCGDSRNVDRVPNNKDSLRR